MNAHASVHPSHPAADCRHECQGWGQCYACGARVAFRPATAAEWEFVRCGRDASGATTWRVHGPRQLGHDELRRLFAGVDGVFDAGHDVHVSATVHRSVPGRAVWLDPVTGRELGPCGPEVVPGVVGRVVATVVVSPRP